MIARNEPPGFIACLLLLLAKDSKLLFRAQALLVGIFGFALLLVVVSSFAFLSLGITEHEKKLVTPGIFWLIFVFTSVLSLNQSFLIERERGALLGIILSPVSMNAFYFSKWLSNAVFICVVQIFVMFFHELFFGVAVAPDLWSLLLVLILSAGAFSAIGTLLSAVAVSVRSRELVLPLVFFPLILPLLSASVSLTQSISSGGGIDFSSFWFWFLVCANSIPLALSSLLFEFVVRD
jgi:heme exporter protein B